MFLLLFKRDIKSAFRLLPIHPQDFELLCFLFDGMIYYDKCALFGCSISPKIFLTFLEDIIKSRLSNKSCCIIWIFGGHKSKEGCENNKIFFRKKCTSWGFLLPTKRARIRFGKHGGQNTQIKSRRICPKTVFVIKNKTQRMQSLIYSLHFCCRAIAVDS